MPCSQVLAMIVKHTLSFLLRGHSITISMMATKHIPNCKQIARALLAPFLLVPRHFARLEMRWWDLRTEMFASSWYPTSGLPFLHKMACLTQAGSTLSQLAIALLSLGTR